MKTIRTLVVDDNAPFREAMKFFLEEQPDIELVSALSEAAKCLTYVNKHPVDVVIMDARMRGIDGPEATQQLKRKHKNIKVVMCTIWGDRELKNYAKRCGADGYFVKGEPLTVLLKKIRQFFPHT